MAAAAEADAEGAAAPADAPRAAEAAAVVVEAAPHGTCAVAHAVLSGLHIVEDFVSDAEEAALLAWCEPLDTDPHLSHHPTLALTLTLALTPAHTRVSLRPSPNPSPKPSPKRSPRPPQPHAPRPNHLPQARPQAPGRAPSLSRCDVERPGWRLRNFNGPALGQRWGAVTDLRLRSVPRRPAAAAQPPRRPDPTRTA